MKMQFLIGLTSVASVSALCCYEGCGKAPTSCNPSGEYCSSEATCGTCGGTWCPDGPTPTPTPPTPTPPTPSPPTPVPEGMTLYCPTQEDLFLEHGNVQFHDGGWTQTGDSRVSTKTTFDLLGGYVEFDMDLSGVNCGVNTNIYTISPDGGDFCGEACYCDIQDNGSPQCMELDIIEANGNCKFSSTWHTIHNGFQGGGCDEGGCAYDGDLPSSQFHMKSTWDATDGMWLTYLNDQPLYVNNYLADALSDKDKSIVKETMSGKGVVLESSQWQGWVPGEGCCDGGDLSSSVFKLTNLKVLGKVLRGPEPTKCDAPAPTPEPTPTPAPTPTPSPSDCPGGSLLACVQQCPSDQAAFAACVKDCSDRCPNAAALV